MEYPEKLSQYVSFAEATKSQTATRLGISNLPSEFELANMRFMAEHIFDRVRIHMGVPIGISSFFRAQYLNKAIGGSPTSQHRFGKAIDIDADIYGRITNCQIFDYIYDTLEFDQLIWEFGDEFNPAWVHVSHAISGKNRGEVFKAIRKDGQTIYEPFDPSNPC